MKMYLFHAQKYGLLKSNNANDPVVGVSVTCPPPRATCTWHGRPRGKAWHTAPRRPGYRVQLYPHSLRLGFWGAPLGRSAWTPQLSHRALQTGAPVGYISTRSSGLHQYEV